MNTQPRLQPGAHDNRGECSLRPLWSIMVSMSCLDIREERSSRFTTPYATALSSIFFADMNKGPS